MTISAQQAADLQVARQLVRAGVPVFLGHPDATRTTGYALPPGWERSVPDESVVDAWAPGMALCAVTGHALDLIDLDPRSGGEMPTLTQPSTYLWADTPSGGRHLFVAPLRVESRDGIWPGVDLKSGTEEGRGRGFAFIAPTVRLAKAGPSEGLPAPYRWRDNALGHLGGPDSTGHEVKQRVLDLRQTRENNQVGPRRLARSAAAAEWDRALDRLAEQVRGWVANGWGGEAHAALLEATRHLVLLSPEHAEVGFRVAFRRGGAEPDEADLGKLESAVDKYGDRADVVVPDEEMDPGEAFWAGQGVVPPFVPESPADRVGALVRGRDAFDFYDEDALAAIPTPEPVVTGLLYRGTVARMFGPSTVGKTWVGLDVAAHVRCGMPWQNREVKQAPTLYVYAEGAQSVGPRLGTWRAEHGRPSGLRVWPDAVTVAGPQWDAFGVACEALGPVLVVLDTQAAMTVGRKESDNDDAAFVLAALRELAAALNACVLLVHHNGWAAEGRARGASAMYAGLDTELELAEVRGGLLLVTRKQRFAERSKPIPLRLERRHDGLVVTGPPGPGQGGEGFFSDDREVRAKALLAELETYLRTGGSMASSKNEAVNHAFTQMHGQGLSKNGPGGGMLGLVGRLYRASIGVQGVDVTPDGRSEDDL